MFKKMILVMAIFMALGSVCLGAAKGFQEISTKNSEMRKSLAWLTEGLSQLGNSKNGKLILTKDQKKKILPIFQTLVDKKLIRLEANVNNGQNGAGGNGNQRQQNQGGQNGQGGQQRGGFDPNDPQAQARMKQMQELTDFGNSKIDLIDALLSKGQLSFIDNLDFNAEKYGFLDFQRMFSNNGQGAGQGASQGNSQSAAGQGANQAAFQQLREKIRAGQDLLVKLNNDVMKMLKS